ncbi:hypothetical protein L210DRAFT_985711 [Boletus edulis BED1]|uniref:GBF1-like tetratricopeptide repeats domain-containing protein n=1 Tax=Boletus edulis BED1 TaxID=1328754 RepID=A0AAD4BA17_BOLED|nr:hypothetical protein L210DRAFT_985711 [Boletus edulis BED1]
MFRKLVQKAARLREKESMTHAVDVIYPRNEPLFLFFKWGSFFTAVTADPSAELSVLGCRRVTTAMPQLSAQAEKCNQVQIRPVKAHDFTEAIRGQPSTQTERNVAFATRRSTVSNPRAARFTFKLVASFASEGPDQKTALDNFAGLLSKLDDFATAMGTSIQFSQPRPRRTPQQPSADSPLVGRGRKSISLIFDLKRTIAPFAESAELQPGQVWRPYCLPLCASLARQSTNPFRLLRNTALLLGPQLIYDEADPSHVEEVFNSVMFPILDELLRPQVYLLDPQGVSETRLRAPALLGKAFMHFAVAQSHRNADIWG